MANKYISEKRKELIDFINEQIVGPGSYLGRYGIDGYTKGEVIDTTPGNVYCSAILFPKKDSSLRDASASTVSATPAPADDAVPMDQDADGNETETVDDAETEEASRDINLRFPQTFGLSCCLDKDIVNHNDLKIKLSGRYYRKLTDLSKLYVNVDNCDQPVVKSFLTKSYTIKAGTFSISSFFKLIGDKLYLDRPNKTLHGDIKQLLDEANKSLCSSIRATDLLWRGSHEIFLETYKEKLYESRFTKASHSVTERDDAKVRIEEIEKAERVISYFYDLLSALDSKGYGFWYAEDFSEEIDLKNIDLNLGTKTKLIYSPKDEEKGSDLKDCVSYSFPKLSKDDNGGLASMSVWIQLTKDNRDSSNDKIYLKVMAENTSDPMKETIKSQYSIVNESVNARSFFGVKIEVESNHLQPYRTFSRSSGSDKEANALNYLYRKIEDYGTGHICSVDWDAEGEIKKVWTDFIPEYDVPDVDTVPQKVSFDKGVYKLESRVKDTKYLEFKTLSTLSNETDKDILDGLHSFIDAYKDWIDEQVDAVYTTEANEVRLNCMADYERMAKNLALLNDSKNMLAFRLMNTAMFMQLWHSQADNQSILQTACRGKREIPEDFYKGLSSEVRKGYGPAAWRSFQLAFIILNMDGIIQRDDDPTWEQRNKVVDLVWFPTGGGKTEAYLGIIAFCVITRRLTASRKNTFGGGTTAIMRYTLRLLATQQFQRAMRLILALDSIRKWGSYNIGNDEPISIGLFVGNDSLPNKMDGDDGLIHEAEDKWMAGQDSKIPLDKHCCPWCGGELEWKGVRVGKSIEYKFRCTKSFCFNGGLPVLLCDELVYKTPPTLLFGTVDKFAMIAHNVDDKSTKKDSRRLFQLNGMSPDLIIQDELHLLSGPLGSAVGLFECAIEQLCERYITTKDNNVIRIIPKVVSSTATTRNTEMQIAALYGRKVNVFPKNGINYDDSFYAFYKRDTSKPESLYQSKRKYVGIMPTGRTAMYAQLRLASCCMAHRALFEKKHISQLADPKIIEAADYYFTLVDYFNSKKDVGTTDAQFSSEFPKYTRQIFSRVLRAGDMLHCYYAYNSAFSREELTGRLNGEEVVNALATVQEKWSPLLRDVHHDGTMWRSGTTPPDLVLATNMISVGIDVSRFNSMLVNSMPRNKAEYIQATSRVARDEKGVVFTIHNPFRARDVSHYEQFREFHEKLYYFVEPISITPFSQKSIERYMPLYLASVIRHKYGHLANEVDAVKLTASDIKTIIDETRDFFTNVQKNCSALGGAMSEILTTDGIQFIEQFTEKALKEWDGKLSKIERYSPSDTVSGALFTSIDAYEEDRLNTCWVVPKSVRVVPVESVIKIKND